MDRSSAGTWRGRHVEQPRLTVQRIRRAAPGTPLADQSGMMAGAGFSGPFPAWRGCGQVLVPEQGEGARG